MTCHPNDIGHRFPSLCREGLITAVAVMALFLCRTLSQVAHKDYDRSVVSTQKLVGSSQIN